MATLNKGTGADGAVTVSSNSNLHTDALAGSRTYADMVCFSCNAITSNTVTTTESPNGIIDGDEILVMNCQGTESNYNNVGNYETFIVQDVNANTITFTSSKTKLYGDNGVDTNLGTSTTNQRVIVQRIPRYTNLTINNSIELTCNDWDQEKYGIMFFRVSNTLTINGTLRAGKGFQGVTSQNGRGIGGYTVGGGVKGDVGSGGGYGTAGGTGNGGGGGSTYGEQTLTKPYMGSAGGSSLQDWPGRGGEGGGVIIIHALVMDVYGDINVRGTNGYPGYQSYTGGGQGSGGSLLMNVGTYDGHSGTVDAQGPDAVYWAARGKWAGAGGDGRIALIYNEATNIASDPTMYTDGTLEIPPAYQIGGELSHNSIVRVYNADTGVLMTTASGVAPSYTIDITAGDDVDIIAKRLSNDDILGFGAVTPKEV